VLRAWDGESGNSAISIPGVLNPFCIRLIWTRVILRHEFQKIREQKHSPTMSDLECFMELISGNLSSGHFEGQVR
jgi:hypothetical protein